MHYLTDHKRATGNGAAHTGTDRHWFMMVSSVGLAFLIPVFVIAFGRALGGSHEEVLAFFSRPFIAILTGLTLVTSMRHFAKGAQMMIEDYTQGITRRVLIIGAISLSWAVTATGLFALAKIAL